MAVNPSSREPALSEEQLMERAITLLSTVPPADRPRLARDQLVSRHPKLVAAFDAIPRDRLKKTVLFISLRPQHAREPKLAATARLAGWTPMLVYCGRANYDVGSLFAFHEQTTDKLVMVLASWLFPGPVIHLFADQGAQAHPFCRIKHRRLVLDLFDTCSGMKWVPDASSLAERQAIASADGMTHRDLRAHYLRRLHGYRLPPNNIFIIDPLTEAGAPPPPWNGGGDGIRVVVVGWTDDGDTSVLQVIQQLCAGEVHVHVYPYPPGRTKDAYRRLQLLYPDYFHLEEPVFGQAFLEHLARYDFGLTPCERYIFDEEPTLYTSDYLRGCGSARLIDYIQAGLGIIVSPDRKFQYACARRYGASVATASIELLRNPRPLLEAALRAKTAKDRSSITIEGVARRLGDFYTRVATRQSNSSPKVRGELSPSGSR